MPYIKAHRRAGYDRHIEALQYELSNKGLELGDLNYIISRLIGFFFKKQRRYFSIADITGVLENVKQEFYRRMAGPYEDEAIVTDGDIPEYEPDSTND